MILLSLTFSMTLLANNRDYKNSDEFFDIMYFNNVLDFVIENNIYDFEVGAFVCTAKVYYNGTLVASFSVYAINESMLSLACTLAYAQAEDYINSQTLNEYYILQEHPGIPGGGDDPIFP